jgi:beta-glucosidase-like glycosyl hydrolase
MVKHFVGFSSPEQGLNTGPVHGGERELRTTYAPDTRKSKDLLTSSAGCHHLNELLSMLVHGQSWRHTIRELDLE